MNQYLLLALMNKGDEYDESLELAIEQMDDMAKDEYELNGGYNVDRCFDTLTCVDLGDEFRKISIYRYDLILDPNRRYNASRICQRVGIDFLELMECASIKAQIKREWITEPYIYRDMGDERTGYYISEIDITPFIPEPDRERLVIILHALRVGHLDELGML